MKKVKKIIEYGIFIAICISLVHFTRKYGNKETMKYYKELNFNGVVIKKYINKTQHNFSMLEIKHSGEDAQKVNLSTDISGLFNYVREKDSVVKVKGILKVHVYRNSTDSVFILNWNNY